MYAQKNYPQIQGINGRYKRIKPGEVFGRLTAIKHTRTDECGNAYWLLKCECGKTKEARSNHLKVGNIKSCGCLVRDTFSTHKRSKTQVYVTWHNMKARCNNPKNSQYHRYGARGIKVCERWIESFENFLEDMGDKPSPEYSIERIDNNGNYEPEKCRWATRTEQSRNRSSNIQVTYKGKKMSLIECTDLAKVSYVGVYKRLKRGWELDRALTTPMRITK